MGNTEMADQELLSGIENIYNIEQNDITKFFLYNY